MTGAAVQRRALLYGGIVSLAILVVGSIIGFLVAGATGLESAAIGAVLAAVFMGITAASILLANRVAPSGTRLGLYFGIIAGASFVKFAAFIVVAISLYGQPWLNPYLFFWSIIAAVIGSLVADGLALQLTRVPYVDVALPGDAASVKNGEK